MFRWFGFLQHQRWFHLPIQWMAGGALSIALLLSPSAYAAITSNLTVTINQLSTQADPVPLNGTTNTRFVAVFSAAITPGSFTPSDVMITGSTATGIVVQSVTEITPMNGTTFEVVASATSVGTVVLSIKGPSVDYVPLTTHLSYNTPTNPYRSVAYNDKIYVAAYNGGGLYEIDTLTDTTRLFSNLNGNAGSGAVAARDGFIYCIGYQTHASTIYRFTPDGTMTNMGVTPAGVGYLTVDSKGNVFFVNGNMVGKITPEGVIDNNWATSSETIYGVGMPSIDSQDNIYHPVSGGKIAKVTPDGVVSIVATDISPLGHNTQIKIYKDEIYMINYLAPDSMTNIKKIDQQGNITIIFDFTKPHPTMITLSDFEILPDGKLLILGTNGTNWQTQPIFIYDPVSNASQTLALPLHNPGASVAGLTVADTGVFYVGNAQGKVFKVAAGTPAPTVTDLNGNSSATSTSTDNVVTLKTVAEMQVIVQARIVAYANDNTNPAPTLDDYAILGVTGVTVENLALVNVFVEASTGPEVDTQPEVQALVDTLNAALQAIRDAQANIVAYANDKTNPAPTLADYQTVGVTGVTALNLAAVNANVDAVTGPEVDTQGEVQALVDRVNAAQAKVVAYANDKTQPAPTVTDYQTLGVTGVTAGNLAAVNAVVDSKTGPDVDTLVEVQTLVDAVNATLAAIAAAQAKIVAYANDTTQPAPTLTDYTTLGVTGVTATNLAIVNANVDALTGTGVDTVPEVQALVNAVLAAQAKIVAYANDNTQPAPTVGDYATLGVTGVTADRLAIVNAKIDELTGVNVDTVPEIQAVVDAVSSVQAKIIAYANDNTQPAPTVADYAAIGVTGVTTNNLAAVNTKVDKLTGTDVNTTTKVQAVVNALNAAQAKIVAYANNNTHPAPTTADYQMIGVMGVTTSNLTAVNAKVDALAGASVDTPLKVQALIDTLIKTLEYTLRRSADGRYHVYMRPTASSANKSSLSGQVTLTVPHGTGNGRFVTSNVQSAVAGVTWTQNSRSDAPVENSTVDYLSFSFSPTGVTAFNWQAGVEQEVFSFLAANTCTGNVGVMSNSDPFNQLPNSLDTSPGNQFTNLGWGSSITNNYLGNYGAPVDCVNALTVQVRGFLQGADQPNVSLMSDSLRVGNLIPAAQPYSSIPFNYAGTEVLQPTLLTVLNDAAIVDWVLVELRDKAAPATRVAAKAALLRRDGAVVDAQTGSTTLSFPSKLPDNYYVVLRHRNHLGVMTKTALALTGTPTLVDFTLPSTATYGTAAQAVNGNQTFLWAGDVDANNQIIANGPGNDLNNALSKVLMSPGNTRLNVNYLLNGYDSSDFNMSGTTLFAGPNNDTNIVLGNVLLHPQNTSFSGNFVIKGTVP